MHSDVAYYNEEENTKFNFRVGMISINNGKILLQKPAKDDYYSLIGGRVKLNETTLDALIREVKEETGIEVSGNEIKLIKVIENFFTYNNKKFHELLYLYKVNNEKLNGMDCFNTLDKDDVVNKWFSFNEIDSMDIRPEIVKNCYLDDVLTHEVID